MKNLTFPILCHDGLRPRITQDFGAIGDVEWYKKNGVNIPFHNGLDVVLGDGKETYGTALITPSENWRIVKRTFESPMSTKGNGVTLECDPFMEDGILKILQVVYWHCSNVLDLQGKLPAHTTVAYMGNSGLVHPMPNIAQPYNGSHLHLMLFEYQSTPQGWKLWLEDNGVGGALNPLIRFDISNLVQGPDDPANDAPAQVWAIELLKSVIEKIKAAFGH